jgi:hypothetical protein
MTRKGKIARLPRHVREELNRRLDDGEQGVRLVDWLNGQKDVKLILDADFGGRPINEQNLTDWKQGGYLDWQQLQQSREWVLLMADEADQLADDSGLMPLSDRVSSMAALTLAKLLRELAPQAQTDHETRQDLFRALRELTRLRREDFKSACMHDQFSLIAYRRRQSRKPEACSVDANQGRSSQIKEKT